MLTFQSASSTRLITPLDLQSIFWRTKSLPKDISSIQGFDRSIGGKPILEKTNSNVIGNKAKKIKRIDVRFKVNGLVSVRENNVTISGSVPWEQLYRILVRLVPEVKSLTFQITNTAVKFYLKKRVKLESIASEKIVSKNYRLVYEPELYFTKLTIKFSDGIVANVFANGTVVAQGRDLKNIEKRVKDVLAKYSDPYGENITKSPVAARKNLVKKRLTMTNARYELANSWNNTRNGYYVRPGPNKRPRFYAVPKNPALVRQKVLRAYANVGVNVPNAVRMALGIAATVPLKPKVLPKKTVSNWNVNAPSGMYVRPGPGGLPKFYKIPKIKSSGRKTVIEAYKKAGVNIPAKVKNIFEIVNSASAKVSPKLKMNISNKGVFRIDGLACSRYKLDDLKRVALKMDIPVTKRTKSDLCKELRKKLNGTVTKSPKVNFTKNGVKHYILINERKVKRNRHIKSMNSFKIGELKNMILALNNSANVSNKKKKNLIELLIERKRTINAANEMFNFSASPSSKGNSPSSKGSPLSQTRGSVSSSSSKGSPSSKSSDVSPVRDPLNIARNILGNGFTNAELQNFLNRYKRSPNLNKLVIEFKLRKESNNKPKRMMKTNVEEL
jgi:hypothetical protein